MKSFRKTFEQIDALTLTEQKPLTAMLAKLMEEVGELAVAVNVNEGHITHKTLDEPLAGEVADVCQVAISILCRHLSHLTPEQRWSKFESYISNKTDKWDRIQTHENVSVCAPKAAAPAERPAMHVLPRTVWTYDLVAKQVRKIVGGKLGLGEVFGRPGFKDDDSFVNDLGADSLDEVELVMTLEDEFDIEISDELAESCGTTALAIEAICGILNVSTPKDEPIDREDADEGFTREDEMFDGVMAQPCFQSGQEDTFDLYAPLPSGRYLSLSERMNERSLMNQQKHERK